MRIPQMTPHAPRLWVKRGSRGTCSRPRANASPYPSRAGHHCCQPLMQRLDVAATTRAAVYRSTTPAEIDALGAALRAVKKVLALP